MKAEVVVGDMRTWLYILLVISYAGEAGGQERLHSHKDTTQDPRSRPTSASAVDDDEEAWIGFLTNRELTYVRRDQAQARIRAWKQLVDDAQPAKTGADEEARKEALNKLHLRIAGWAASLTREQQMTALELLSQLNVDANPGSKIVKSVLLMALDQLLGKPVRGRDSDASEQAAKATRLFNINWNRALNDVVTRDQSGKLKTDPNVEVTYQKGANTLPERIKAEEWIKRQIDDFGYDNLTRWAVSVGGEKGEKVLHLLAHTSPGKVGIGVQATNAIQLPTGTGNTEQLQRGDNRIVGFADDSQKSYRERFRDYFPTHSQSWDGAEFRPPQGETDSPKAEHHPTPQGQDKLDAAHFLEHVGSPEVRNRVWDVRPENRPEFDNKTTNRVSRSQALDDPFVLSVLDKCISCHATYLDPKFDDAFLTVTKDANGFPVTTTRPPTARKLLTRASLYNALLIDPGPGLQGFQKKINDMMGANAQQRHIHFTEREIRAIQGIINYTKDDEKAAKRPEYAELADQIGTPDYNERPSQQMLREDFDIKMAQFRCVSCHRDPSVNISGVDTFTGLREAMMDPDRFNEATLMRMINYGYNDERPVHVKNLDEPLNVLSANPMIVNYNGGLRIGQPILMKDKILNFIKTRDQEKGK